MNDMHGNKINEGDLVHVKVGLEWVDAQVIKVSDGGISVTGVPQRGGQNNGVGQTPPSLIIQMNVFFGIPPGVPNPAVRKLARDGAVKSILETVQ